MDQEQEGLLASQMPGQPPAPGAAPGAAPDAPPAGGSPDELPQEATEALGGEPGNIEELMDPKKVMAQMVLPDELKPMLEKLVLAGTKVMFDPKSHELMLKELDAEGPLAKRMADGVAGLMGVLSQESAQSIPPQLIIPAGLVLLAYVAQFLKQAGQPVPPDEYADAVQMLVDTILQQFNIDSDKLADIGAGGQGTPPGMAEEPEMAPAEGAAPAGPPATPEGV